MLVRVLIVAALAALVVFAVLRTRRPVDSDVALGLRVPADLLARNRHTWIVFSTPYCATCGPAEVLLRERFPADDVRRAEVADWPETVEALGIRRAPTALRVDQAGAVEVMLAGPEAIRQHLAVASLA